ncbi:MAG: ABC transporter ATP-binding protein [Prochlorotrichaceae cyanobacterium]
MFFPEDHSLLSAQGLSKRFGTFSALAGVQIQVAPQSITGVIGPNGAGKTTLFNLLAGFVQPDRGTIAFQGKPIQHLSPHARVQRGMVRTFQLTRVLARMSVLENLLVAAPQGVGEQIWQVVFRQGAMKQQQREFKAQALTVLEAIGLGDKAQEQAGALSGGQRKLLELGRALMTQPRLILLDEPAAGVNPALIEQLCDHILHWNRQGITFLIIEHNMDVVMSLCQQIWVLAEGKNLMHGSPQAVQSHPEVLDAYLGQPLGQVIH